MAEGIARKAGWISYSAGTKPEAEVNLFAVKVMGEIGIDISYHTSDPIDDYLHLGIDVVITVCDSAKQICPVFPGNATHVHWSIDDPFQGWTFEKSKLDSFRDTREIIKKKIEGFIQENL